MVGLVSPARTEAVWPAALPSSLKIANPCADYENEKKIKLGGGENILLCLARNTIASTTPPRGALLTAQI
jgi:hypothetical protein